MANLNTAQGGKSRAGWRLSRRILTCPPRLQATEPDRCGGNDALGAAVLVAAVLVAEMSAHAPHEAPGACSRLRRYERVPASAPGGRAPAATGANAPTARL